MTNEEKMRTIRPWIDPEDRVTVHFIEEQDLNAEVTGCNAEVVDLSIETRVPHFTQHISVPLRRTEASEDLGHYTRDPDRPLKHRRLMLVSMTSGRPSLIS